MKVWVDWAWRTTRKLFLELMSTWDYLCFTMNQSMAMQLIFTEEQTVHYFNF